MREEDTLRILLSTDNHLGYAEKDPIRGEDSFTSFEEMLQIAKEKKVDMVLLGGDLFHENKPSRSAEKKCVDILRKYVLGDDPIEIQLLSDPEVNFKHCQFKRVNFEDQDINVGLPIFSIHGNHDDPSGLGGFAVLDTLHSTGLINYFGKISDLKNVQISPLLIQKGVTTLALYGLSSLKDERLHKMFTRNEVKMVEPSPDWFNLFVLHQNRAKHGPTNYIPEHFIDGFVNLVLWGHEHECRIEPETSVHGDKEIFITQPGSSVATSLSEGESKPKKIGLLSIYKDKFKIEPIELKTVRPMIFRHLILEESKLKLGKISNDKEIRHKVEDYLSEYVEEMLIESDSLITGHPSQPTLPLLRLRVEYYDERFQLTPGRFGNLFHNRVANPSEILLFRKKSLKTDSSSNADFDPTTHHHLEASSMKDFVSQYFDKMESDETKKLKVLGVRGLATAVEKYIEKDQKNAISLIVEKQMSKMFDILFTRIEDSAHEEDVGNILEELRLIREDKKNQAQEEKDALQMLENTSDVSNGDAGGLGAEDDMDSYCRPPQPAPTRGTRGRGRGRASSARGSKTATAKANSSSIQQAFLRQSQRTSSSRRSQASMYINSDDSD